MWRTIKKGKHNNFSIPGIHFGKTSETYEVMFDESCRHYLNIVDQLDWNKLFGWSYGLHHKNSIRVGWRYNVALDVIELCLYTYYKGIRIIERVEQTYNIGEYININLCWHYNTVQVFTGNDNKFWTSYISMNIKPTWGYNLDLWFGGDEVAPHDIRVWLEKIQLG